MTDLTIACPTHGRAGQVTTFRTFGEDLLLVVAESQHEAYKAAHPHARFDVHPDSVVGLGPKIKWMLDKYGSMFRVDDDADYMIDHVNSRKITDPQVAKDLVYRLADQAEQMDAYIYGFTELAKPLYFSGHQPFKLTGLLEGGKIGFREGHGIWWPENHPWLEDAWVSAMNAFKNRYCLIDQRYCLPTLVGQRGGLANTRTMERVWKMADTLKAAFGDAVDVIPRAEFDDVYPYRLRIPW
jgi:hypothetical protein